MKKESSNSSNHKSEQYSGRKPSYQKHLGILLDEKIDFKQHINSAILKISKGISAIKNFATEIFSNNSQKFFKAPN